MTEIAAEYETQPDAYALGVANAQARLDEQTQQMAVSGSPSLPLTWTVLNPAVATISPTGLLTAVHSGVTQVRATDNIGSTDVNTLVRVYDFKATLGTVTTRPGTTVRSNVAMAATMFSTVYGSASPSYAAANMPW